MMGNTMKLETPVKRMNNDLTVLVKTVRGDLPDGFFLGRIAS